jgi:hypothetical protein
LYTLPYFCLEDNMSRSRWMISFDQMMNLENNIVYHVRFNLSAMEQCFHNKSVSIGLSSIETLSRIGL